MGLGGMMSPPSRGPHSPPGVQRWNPEAAAAGGGEGHPGQPPASGSDTNPEGDLSAKQKKLIISKVVKIACLNVFKNHCYYFKGVRYLQLAGGPIGLRLTSIVARVVMDHWLSMFTTRLDGCRVGDQSTPQVRR